jgi:hypothetical protein
VKGVSKLVTTILAKIYALAVIFLQWMKYPAIILLVGLSAWFLFRREKKIRVAAVMLSLSVLFSFCIYYFAYDWPPRVNEGDMIRIHEKMSRIGYDENLSLVEIQADKEEYGYTENNFGYTYMFDKYDFHSSDIDGSLYVYEDDEMAIKRFSAAVADSESDYRERVDDVFYLLGIYSPVSYETEDFQAYSTALRIEKEPFLWFILNRFSPTSDYYYCNTVIRFKNSVITIREDTHIPWKNRMNYVLQEKLDYNKLLVEGDGGIYRDYFLFRAPVEFDWAQEDF